MNSIIKQINFDKESQEILGYNKMMDFVKNTNGQACIFFVADWSVPSRLTYKRIKKVSCNRKKIGFVDVDLVDNIELCTLYKVTKVPHCIVFENDQILFEFVGLDIEKLNDALLKFNMTEAEHQKQPPTQCPSGHEYQPLTKLPYPPYVDNLFFCNRCKKIDTCSQSNPVLHCGECDYDMCKYCQLVSS